MGDRLATTDMGRKELLCPFPGGGQLGPHLTQCHLGWGLPPYQVASWSIQPFGPQYNNVTDRQDNRPIAQGEQLLVRVAQKLYEVLIACQDSIAMQSAILIQQFRLSIDVSYAGIVLKWLIWSSCNQCHTNYLGTISFPHRSSWWNADSITLNGSAKCRWVENLATSISLNWVLRCWSEVQMILTSLWYKKTPI